MPETLQSKIIKLISGNNFLWILCAILNIITFFIVYFKVSAATQNLALKYSVVSGILWYGEGINLYFIPGVAAAVTLLNFFLFFKVKKLSVFLPELCLFASLGCQIVVLAAMLFLTRVN